MGMQGKGHRAKLAKPVNFINHSWEVSGSNLCEYVDYLEVSHGFSLFLQSCFDSSFN